MGDTFFIWGLVLLIVVIAIRLKFRSTQKRLHSKLAPELKSPHGSTTDWMPVIPWSAQRIADLEMGWLKWLLAVEHSGLRRLIDSSLAQGQAMDVTTLPDRVDGCDAGQLEYFKALLYRGCLYPSIQDKKKETRLLQLAADKGQGVAFFDLAQREFINAIGRQEQDAMKLAEALYQRAADHGQARALFMLGVLCICGSLRAGARQQGMEWLKQAADRGHVAAQYLLGQAYLDRDSPYHQPSRGLGFLRQAAASSHPRAQLLLAQADDALSAPQAVALLREAADWGLADAQLALAQHYRRTGQAQQGLQWAEKAAAQQRAEAFVLLARLTAEQQIQAQGYDAALNRWFQFETSERNRLLLAKHLYLAAVWIAAGQSRQSTGVQEALLSAVALLDAEFSEIDFDRLYRALEQVPSAPPYFDFLLWLFSDYCQSTSREDNQARLQAAADAGLRVALLTQGFLLRQSVATAQKGLFAKEAPAKQAEELLWQQAQSGCSAACYLAAQSKIAAGEFAVALELLQQAAKAGLPEAQVRTAYLLLGQFDYEFEDEGFSGLVIPDQPQAVHLLEQAAENGQRHAAELLSRLYLQDVHTTRDFSKALYYHQFALQNFSEEESFDRHLLSALKNVE